MRERLKELRKELKLTQQEFADKLGTSRGNIGSYEVGKSAPSDAVISLICKTFCVSEDWLRNGTKPIFVQPDTFSLDDFVKSKGATDLELEIVKTYFELDPKIRKAAIDHFRTKLAATFDVHPNLSVPDEPENLEKECPPVNEADEQSNVG